MSDYRFTPTGVIRLSDDAQIPHAPGNRDWLAYVSWSEAGGVTMPEHTLEGAKEQRLVLIEAACANAITEGFNSSALNAAYRYPSKASDQSNLQASVLASLLPGLAEDWTTPFWCQDVTGTWSYRPHTAAQIQRVGIDAKDAINACIARKILLEQQVEEAINHTEVEAVTWTT